MTLPTFILNFRSPALVAAALFALFPQYAGLAQQAVAKQEQKSKRDGGEMAAVMRIITFRAAHAPAG